MRQRTAILLCVLGMVLVGSSVAVSQLLLDFPLLTGQAIRYAAAAAILFLIARRRTRPTLRELGIIAVLALLGMAAFNACILIGLKHAEPATVGTVIGAAPLGLALLGPLLHKARPSLRLVLAAAIVVGGTVLVEGTGRTDAIGLAAAIGALIGEIAFSLLAALVIPRLGAIPVAAYSCALATPQLLLGGLLADEYPQWRMPTLSEAGALTYLALFMTVIAFVAWFTGLNRLGVQRAGMLVGIMPLATLATAAVMAGSLPRPAQILGVAAVAAGLFTGLTTSPEQPPTSDQPASEHVHRSPAVAGALPVQPELAEPAEDGPGARMTVERVTAGTPNGRIHIG